MRIGWGSALAIAFGLLVPTTACAPVLVPASAGFVVEEHALRSAPVMEPLTFAPVGSSMDEVLAVHAAERLKRLPNASVLIEGRHAMRVILGTDELTATEHYDAATESGWVSVTDAAQEIYAIETGKPSPITGLRGLWAYDQHWVLETAYIEAETYAGRLSMDGALAVPGGDKEEAFDFQVLRGRPFYFFLREGQIGLSFDGKDLTKMYAEVPHYQCCSASALNPVHAEGMLTFFARRGETWYYVEAGIFH